jgi:catechol 2,3-dioxygenase-like lactoylglutathione lyase family enzyme
VPASATLAVVIDHVTLQVTDVAASRAFYETLLGPVGLRPDFTDGEAVGFGDGTRYPFWLGPATRPERRELHLAFSAPDRAVVRDFYRAAISIGAEILHPPRVFPEYHPHYFGCFVRDPDGHNIEAVCHRPG